MPPIKILLSSYAVKPNSGSEPGNGWNFFVNLQKRKDVDVWLITEIEFKDSIVKECKSLGINESRIHFCDIGDTGRKLCWDQGNWFFYIYYLIWQKKVLKLAKGLHKKINFDICHHNNMCGFREMGYLYHLKDTKFVVGPIGGVGNANLRLLLSNYGFKYFFIELVKKILNWINYRLPKIKNVIKNSDVAISAYPEVKVIFEKIYNINMPSIPETSTENDEITTEIYDNEFHNKDYFIIIAKNVPRKFLKLGIAAFRESNTNHSLFIFGDDPLNQLHEYKSNINSPNVGISYFGFIEKDKLQSILLNAKGHIFPSLHDANPGAIMESLSFGVPVICFDKWGASSLVSDDLFKISEKNKYDQILFEYKKNIKNLSKTKINKNQRALNGNKFRAIYSWDSTIEKIVKIYKKISPSI